MKRYKHHIIHQSLTLLFALFVAQGAVAQSTLKGISIVNASDASRGEQYRKENAIDGNKGTYYRTTGGDNTEAFLLLDVGNDYAKVNSIEFYVQYTNHAANTVTIYSSDTNYGDNVRDWRNEQSVEINNFNNQNTHTIPITLQGQYVYIYMEANSGRQFDISELTFYVTPEVDTTPVTGNRYSNIYRNTTINHKPAKWYDIRKEYGQTPEDDFDGDEGSKYVKSGNGTNMQATHTLVDTIYVHRGTVTRLTIPDYLGSANSNQTYQRWYNYENDGLFTYRYNNQDIDLLTPATDELPEPGNPTTAYRFANGYLGQPVADKGLIAMDFYFPDDEAKDAYYVVCDVSGYQDFTPEYDTSKQEYTAFGQYRNGYTNEYWEPTLSHRYLFYICAIENENSWAYKQYNNDKGELPIQEMDITFPATRIPNHTQELVALAMDAQSYLTPNGNINEAAQALSVSLATNTAGITLETTSLSGTERIIHFSYPDNDPNNDGTETVNIPTDGSKPQAVIEVKREDYVAARFNLTFDESARLLSQSQLQLISDNEDKDGNLNNNAPQITGTILEDYANRTPKYLMHNYELLTEMNFDYDTTIGNSYGQSQSYPFPLGWTDISYGFYDGSNGTATKKTVNGQAYTNVYNQDGWRNGFKTPSKSYCPKWGFYGILNTYVEGKTYGWNETGLDTPNDNEEVRMNSKGQKSTYHLYADTSDHPGTIARLPFTEPLCNGTELFITAWVKCARSNSGKDNAAALFSIMGVKTENVPGVGDRTTYVPIHRFQTGQIPFTYQHGGDPTISSTGYNRQENDWMQVYFSFINDADADYESYVLQVDNNSGSTDGGDIYIDDIRVYIATPDASITQLEATCTNERTMTNIQLDWERLTQRLGVNTNAGEIGAGNDPVTAFDYCFVDAKTYNDFLAKEGNATNYAGAIEAAVVEIGDSTQYNQKYVTIYFHNIFDNNTKANQVNGTVVHPNLLVNNKQNDGNYYLYSMTERGNKYLTGDFYAAFVPNREYWMLMKPHSDTGTVDAKWFAQDIDSPCAIRTPFDVSAQTLIRVNGQVTVPTSDYCAGQVLNFTAQVRVPTGEKDEAGLPIYETLDEEVYYDWFFGTSDEFIAQNPDYSQMSLEVALKTFRDIAEFRDKKDLDGVTPGTYKAPDGTDVELTPTQIGIIQHYLEEIPAQGGTNAKLVLHESGLNITLLETGLELVVQPIPVVKPADVTEEYWKQVCWSYVPLTLTTNSKAPELHAGFNGYRYPTDKEYSPSLRIGLDQIEMATTDSNTPLHISLRGAKYTTDGVDHLDRITDKPNGRDYEKIYLIGTDDPAYKDFFSDEEGGFDQLSLPIGNLIDLEAHEYLPGSSLANVAVVKFDTKTRHQTADGKEFQFTPKEGYTYTFTIHYQEIMRRDAQASTACYGMFSVPMKIVPKYLVWQGKDGTANWNNDENWKRADKDELKKADDDRYETNTQNTTNNGFVPMLFSNVVMPAGSQAQLYMAGYDQDGSGNWYWNNTEEFARPVGMEAPTENIQYDLMAFEQKQGNQTVVSTQRYRVNLCNDIHFEPEAQMLHAEQLIYNKAWMDITLPVDSWTAISTPLQEVVSGDWYTQSATGKQETPYFEDINFGTGYNRLNPAVYQRSWSNANVIGNNVNGSVSFSNNWSAAYNDAGVAYEPAEGYSIRGRKTGATQLVFRLPKADDTYQNAQAFTRDENKVGKLLISDLYNRSNPNQPNTQENISVQLTAANGDGNYGDGNYLMVGNPYMAELDLQKFLEANNDVLTQQYTYVNAAGETATASYNTKTSKWKTNGVDADNAFIKPYGVFYALPLTEGATSATVKFSADMQRLTPATTTENPDEQAYTGMLIEASSERGTSKASVNYASTASDNYLRTEDAALLTGIGENAVPHVFTAADNMAITVNQLQGQTRIPLGVYADANEAVTLTFHNMDGFREPALYDAKNQTSTPLYDGYQVMVTGDNFGQYFITSKGPLVTGIENVETAEDEIQVNSMIHRQVVVTANSDIEGISIYSANGTLLRRVTPAGDTTCTIDGVASGVAVVIVKTANNNDTFKIIIK